MGLSLRGVAASPGYAIGKACLMRLGSAEMPRLVLLEPAQVPREQERFTNALRRARADLVRIRARLDDSSVRSFAAVTDAHISLLQDPGFVARVCRHIEASRLSADWGLAKTLNEMRTELALFDDPYVRERTVDLDLLGERLHNHLHCFLGEGIADIRQRPIIVARDLSDTGGASLAPNMLQGLAMDRGGRTCRAAVAARSLGVPAVVGLGRITDAVQSGDTIILDGIVGELLVDPDPDTLEDYVAKLAAYSARDQLLVTRARRPALTRDQCRIPVRASIDSPSVAALAIARGADGIGLLRTEFLYADRGHLPTEDEHYCAYRAIAECVAPHPLVVRIADLGATELMGHAEPQCASSSALGLRGIRSALRQSHLLKTQLKAILRAGVHGDVRALLPMASTVEEVSKAKQLLLAAELELEECGEEYDEEVPLGVMVEVPAAVSIADLLAREVDFLTINANNLIQYVMAADRSNEEVAYLYQPHHPAVIRMIDSVISAAHDAGKRVTVCGEMAGELDHAAILLGLGADELSTNPLAVPQVKRVVCATRIYASRTFAGQLLGLKTADDVRRFVGLHLHVPTEMASVADECDA